MQTPYDLSRCNYTLLVKQRECLEGLIYRIPPKVTEQEEELLTGLVNFLATVTDAIEDALLFD